MSCTVVQICFTIARPGATMIGVHHDDVYCPSSLSRNKLVDDVEKAAYDSKAGNCKMYFR